MPTGDQSDMDEQFAQLTQLVSGLPAMQAAIHGITQNFQALSTVVAQLQSAMASIEPLRLIVAEHGKVIEDMRLRMISLSNASTAGSVASSPDRSKRRMVSHEGGFMTNYENTMSDNSNNFLIKLSGMEDNLDREERLAVAKKVLSDLGENIEANVDFRTYGKFGREVILKFNTTEQANDFFTRRTSKDSPEPMHKTIAGENKRLWWNRMKTQEQYKKGNATGKCCMALHKMREEKLFNDPGTDTKITCDRNSGTIYIGRHRVAFVRMGKDGNFEVGVVVDGCNRFGIIQDNYITRARQEMDD
mmetsp:Transcript_61736/g.162173  ORF Transcript_61736/g.162173 Transcript_61736/m.162173 type:complete len:303 (-) Transcript_61736:167-1075(-)